MKDPSELWTPLPRPCLVCLTRKRVHHQIDVCLEASQMQPMNCEDSPSLYQKPRSIAPLKTPDDASSSGTTPDSLLSNATPNNEKALYSCSQMIVAKVQHNLSLKRKNNSTCANKELSKGMNEFKHPMSTNTTNKDTSREIPRRKLETNSTKQFLKVTLSCASRKQECLNDSKITSKSDQPSKGRTKLRVTPGPALNNQSNIKQTLFTMPSTSNQSFSVISTISQSLPKKKHIVLPRLTVNNSQLKSIELNSSSSSLGNSIQEDELTCCPLCQMTFSMSWMPVEKDAHIAVCLSETSEDINW